MTDLVRQRGNQREFLGWIRVKAYVPWFLLVDVHLRNVIVSSGRKIGVSEFDSRSVERIFAQLVTVHSAKGVCMTARAIRYKDIGMLSVACKRQRRVLRPQIEGRFRHT